MEEIVRSTGSAELDAYEIGLTILGPLRDLDEVAYLRFASVYQAFDSLDDFEAAITVLRAEHEGASADAVKAAIQRLVAAETEVLSDDQLVDALKAQGMVLARRTVAKYREAVGIGSSVQRRRQRAIQGKAA